MKQNMGSAPALPRPYITQANSNVKSVYVNRTSGPGYREDSPGADVQINRSRESGFSVIVSPLFWSIKGVRHVRSVSTH